MYPVSHFLVPLLLLTAYTVARVGRLPRGGTVLVLLFATQLPDLIDKPLAWTFGILPSGRMLAHSLVVAVPAVVVLAYVAHRRGYGAENTVFAFGYFSHLVGDHYPVLYLGRDYYFFPNMFWPLMAPNPDLEPSFAANAPDLGLMMIVLAGVVVFVCLYALVDSYRRIDAHRGELHERTRLR